MAKLSALIAEKGKADIQIGGSSFGIVFYVLWRSRFEPEKEWPELMALGGREHLKMLLPKILLSWDLVDDDGHAIPVTAEAMEQHEIPDALLNACAQRIVNSDLSGKVPTSSNSPGT